MKIKKRYFYLILISMFIVLTSVFIYKYIKNESPVYIFDYSGYHEIYKQYSEEALDTPIKFVKDVFISIRNSDYNCSPILLLLPFFIVFEKSRLGYILALGIFYIIPTIVLMITLIYKMLFEKENKENKTIINSNIFVIFIVIATFLYTRWWSPTLRGLPDIISIIPLLVSALIIQRYSFLEKQKVYVPISVGFLLYLCFLFRRYFIYEIIGFYCALFIVKLMQFIHIKEKKKKNFIYATKNFLIAGITTLCSVLIVQFPLVKTILVENYSESYSAFQVSILTHWTNAVNEFGWLILIFAIIGAVYTVMKKEHRYNGLFALLNIFICYFTFSRVQAMGVHHYLTISVWIFILFIYGIYAIYTLLKNNWIKYTWLLIIITLMILNFCSTYIFRNLKIPYITQNNKYCKFYYENFNEVERLINDLDLIVSEKNCKFSVLASSEILSDSLIDLLGTNNMKKSIVYTSTIDLRDGINFNSLMNEYIVVTDISQTGVSTEGQRVISVPNEAIYNNTSIGKAYTMVSGPYTIKDGVKAYIYRKDRAFTKEEVSEYMELLISYHPEWKEEYNYLDRAILMSKRELGENIGEVRRYKYNTLYFSPGDTNTNFIMNLDNKIEELNLKCYIDGDINENDNTAGNVKLTIKNENQILFQGEITEYNSRVLDLQLLNSKELTFIVDKNEYLNCDWLYIDVVAVKCID